MTFIELRFPPDISYGAKGGPVFSTDIISSFSGHEQRNINWRNARSRYNISSGVKTKEQWQELIAFFRVVQGRAIGFRYKDWSDYQGINQLIAIGDGIKKEFKLIKDYITGPYKYSRIISKPVRNNFFQIYIDSLPPGGDSFSINFTTGIISFANPPRRDEEITADFEFDVPVRFDCDNLDLSMDSYGISSWQNISLVEIRMGE